MTRPGTVGAPGLDHGRKPANVEKADYPGEVDLTSDRAKLIANLRTAASILEVAGPDLPGVLSIGVNVDEITIQPWQPGAPVSAMRKFEHLMTGDVTRVAYPTPLPGDRMSILVTTGVINGVQVTVSATTYRSTPVDGRLGVSEQAMAELAAQETAHDDPGPDYVLAELLADGLPVATDLATGALVQISEEIEEIRDGDDAGAAVSARADGAGDGRADGAAQG